MKYEIKNWREFQHYKDRNPPWIKLHFSILHSEDWVTLSDASRVLAIVCMLVASRNDGVIDGSAKGLSYIRRVAYLEKSPNLKPLVDSGFLIPLADASTCKLAQADVRPETETESEEETEKETETVTSADEPPTAVEISSEDRIKPYTDWMQKAKLGIRPAMVDLYDQELKAALDLYHERRGGRLTPTRLGEVGKALLKNGTIQDGMLAIEIFVDDHAGNKDHKYLIGIVRRIAKLTEQQWDAESHKHRSRHNGSGLWTTASKG